ncbi:MAG TPA: hypothetical protein VLB29_16880 [Nocardioidaceae bacterium]|nr:hypothetical protein [Nocardioidaceae bacterium]
MDPRRIASIFAVLGGVGWLAKVFLIWRSGGETESLLVWGLAVAGWAAFAVALGAAGYTLVEKAPVWLRGVVAVATALLVLMLWQLLDQGIKATYDGETWLRDELSVVVAALIALGMGFWGFSRRRPEPPSRSRRAAPPARGRRAAR